MASTLDVYQLCPCGSGKKIKFCCQNILADMEKVKNSVTLNNPSPRLAKALQDGLHLFKSLDLSLASNAGRHALL